MSEVNSLKASIIEQAHQEGRLKLEAVKAQNQKDFDKQKSHLLAEKMSERQRKLQEIQASFQLEAQKMKHEERQSTLVSKQKVLKELFAAALEQMKQWSWEEELVFVQKILDKYAQEAITVQFGQITAAKLNTTAFQELRTAYPYVDFKESFIEQEAGLVVSYGKIDDTYLYDDLIRDVYQDESSHIAADIFREK